MLRGMVAEEVDAAAHMGERLIHRDDRIEKHLEIGALLWAVPSSGGGGCQMAACREPHDTNLLNLPFALMFAHQSHCSMHILKRYLLHSRRQTIREYCQGYALLIEPLSQIMTLRSMPYIPIAAPRAAENSLSTRLLRQIDGKRRVGHSPRMDAIRLIRLVVGP